MSDFGKKIRQRKYNFRKRGLEYIRGNKLRAKLISLRFSYNCVRLNIWISENGDFVYVCTYIGICSCVRSVYMIDTFKNIEKVPETTRFIWRHRYGWMDVWTDGNGWINKRLNTGVRRWKIWLYLKRMPW